MKTTNDKLKKDIINKVKNDLKDILIEASDEYELKEMLQMYVDLLK